MTAATAQLTNSTAKCPDFYSPETGTYRSVHRPVNLPENPFIDVVSHIFAHNHNGGAAFTDSSTGHSISYSQLYPLVKSTASGLHQLGISQGDVVLLLLPNSVYYPIVFLGLLYLGATVTSMIPSSSISEIKRQVSDCGVSFAFTAAGRAAEFKVLGVNAIAVPENVIVSREGEFLSFYKVLSGGCLFSRPVIQQDDPAAILYSSGTTGVNKGVVLTHRNLIAMVEVFVRFEASQYVGSSSWDNVYLAVLPMSHIYGLSLFVLGLVSLGSSIIVMKRFDVDEVVKVIERFGVTHFPVVPPILKSLANRAKCDATTRLRSLKQVSSGAASLDKRSIQDFLETLPHVDFIQGYGMTETSAVGTRGFNTEKLKKYYSVGLLAPNMEAKVVDLRNGSFLPPGRNGELLLRGPGIMQGYMNNEKATTSTINEEGWLHTGDIVHFDRDGFLYIVDRLKDTIKYNGFQIAPADLESALISHPDILDVAVAGVADEVSGEIPVAFVIRKSGNKLSEKDVIEYAAMQVAPNKKVRRVVFVSAIPKSPAGKVLRRELRKMVTSRL